MSFAAPLFLLGLLAIAVPILIHLSRRRTQEVVAFPSLMFLSRVPYKSLRRRRLRDQLLLLMRCLALAALALAFARPLLQDRTAQLGGERRDVVVLLDRSFSMGFGDRWSTALDDARSVIDSLQANDSLTLIAFDESAEVIAPASGDRGRLRAALESVAPGSKTTRYAPALRLARSQVIESQAPARGVVLIGDLQRGGFAEALTDLRLPVGTDLEILDAGRNEAEPPTNFALADVTLDRSHDASTRSREMLGVGVRLLRLGDSDEVAAASASVELELNGRVVATREVDLAAEPGSIGFDPVELENDVLTRGRVRLAESLDRLAADDELLFTVSPEAAVPVLVLDGGAGDRRRTLYLERALATGRSPRFDVARRAARDTKPTDLEGAEVVVVLDAGELLSDELRAAIDRFVEAGGGLLVTVGRRGSGGWRALELPGEEPVEQQLGGRSLAYVEVEHPAFASFSAARYGDFSSARFYRFRRLPEVGDVRAAEAGDGGGEGPAQSASRALMRFDDGSPALIEIDRGAGRVLVWASTLDNQWGDLVVQPVFVPLADALVRYLSGHQPARDAYRVGQIASLELPRTDADEWLVTTPSGSRSTVATAGELLLPLEESGFYEIRAVEGSEEEGLVVAANVDPRESDLSELDPDELALALRPPATEPPAAAGDPRSSTDPERDRSWWFVLLAVLLLLVGESLFSNRRRGVRGSPVQAAGS